MLPLIEADQRALLRIARRALEEGILGKKLPAVAAPHESIRRPGGAFVTLRKAGALRGCIGRFEASTPLHRTVYECALSAAREDPRFEPVQAEEVPHLQIEISALSPLAEANPEDIQVGVHGVLVTQGARQGLLLPQVASEWGWDRTRFLEQTCLKAGLEKDAWRSARIRIFTAQVFSER